MKPFHKGRKEFRNPKLETVNGRTVLKGNPYDEGTKDYRDYEFGWQKAYFENQKLVSKKEKSRAGG